jgi:hypothetical protein
MILMFYYETIYLKLNEMGKCIKCTELEESYNNSL